MASGWGAGGLPDSAGVTSDVVSEGGDLSVDSVY